MITREELDAEVLILNQWLEDLRDPTVIQCFGKTYQFYTEDRENGIPLLATYCATGVYSYVTAEKVKEKLNYVIPELPTFLKGIPLAMVQLALPDKALDTDTFNGPEEFTIPELNDDLKLTLPEIADVVEYVCRYNGIPIDCKDKRSISYSCGKEITYEQGTDIANDQ